MEHTFEDEEMSVFGIDIIVSGTVEFNAENTAVGYLPYGDTHVWHPGDGHQPTDVTLTDLTNISAGEENIITLLNQGKDKVWESIAMKVDLDDVIESAMESAKEDAELARHGL